MICCFNWVKSIKKGGGRKKIPFYDKKKGIVLGPVISKDGIEVDKAKTDLIVNLPPPPVWKR